MINNKNKIKIGIITLYHNSKNYGGLLQAYALSKYLRDNGYQCEVIDYQDLARKQNGLIKSFTVRTNGMSLKNKIMESFLFFLKIIKKINNRFLGLFHSSDEVILKRNSKFKNFRDKTIPHSTITYNYNNICSCQNYDIYITGSDQVWNLKANHDTDSVNRGYWLTFVTGKKKIAYAASPSLKLADNSDYIKIAKAIKDYRAISVREKSSLPYLRSIIKNNYELFSSDNAKNIISNSFCVVDPVYLLNKQKWQVLEDKTFVPERKYVFTYFLGESKTDRCFVKNFCRINNYLLVDIPYMLGTFRLCDYNFADYNKYCGPEGFLSLIDNAEYVFTDSFHATSFSLIFHKKFFVFKRYANGKEYNNDRMEDILDTAGCPERMINSQQKFDDNLNNELKNMQLDYDNIQKRLDAEIKKSKYFLLNAIEN